MAHVLRLLVYASPESGRQAAWIDLWFSTTAQAGSGVGRDPGPAELYRRVYFETKCTQSLSRSCVDSGILALRHKSGIDE